MPRIRRKLAVMTAGVLSVALLIAHTSLQHTRESTHPLNHPSLLTERTCLFSPWSGWTPCVCVGFSRDEPIARPAADPAARVTPTRTRTRKVVSATEQSVCETKLEEEALCPPCGLQRTVENSCNPGPWSPWGPCRSPCGFGTRNRSREFLHTCRDADPESIEYSVCPPPRPVCTFPTAAQSPSAA